MSEKQELLDILSKIKPLTKEEQEKATKEINDAKSRLTHEEFQDWLLESVGLGDNK